MSCQCGCEDVYDSLFELLDGDCSHQRRAELRQKIESCPGCFSQLGIEEEVRALVRRCCCEAAPPTLRERVSIQIQTMRITKS